MKKTALLFVLFFAAGILWAKTPLSFTKFSLDDTRASVEKILKSEYKGKYTTDEWGGYTVDAGGGKIVEIGMEEDKVVYIGVTHRETSFTEYNALVGKLCQKYGEPGGYYSGDDGIVIYWYPSEYSYDHRITLTANTPYTWTEMVFYGK